MSLQYQSTSYNARGTICYSFHHGSSSILHAETTNVKDAWEIMTQNQPHRFFERTELVTAVAHPVQSRGAMMGKYMLAIMF